MPSIGLKKFLARNKDAALMLEQLVKALDTHVVIEDQDGETIFGTPTRSPKKKIPINLNGELLGWINENTHSEVISDLLIYLVEKEVEKKKIGQEVLNLYREINLMYNFSEKLAESIEPDNIAAIALQEARQMIESDSGAVMLIDEKTGELLELASFGPAFLGDEALREQEGIWRSVIANEKSGIIHDFSSAQTIAGRLNTIESVIHATMKVEHRVMGSIMLVNKNNAAYKAADLKLLTTLALQSASAIESALLYKKNIQEVLAREEAIRRIHQHTTKFVPVEFIKSLGHEAITDVQLGDMVERVVTVLFMDIRDYTTLSEQMTPQENFFFNSSFHRRMGPVIRENSGFVNQYLGDGIMAIFPDHAHDALNAAIQMQETLHEYNAERVGKDRTSIRIGIGMHTGSLIMGITGDHHRMDAATISDTVNTAARIESLTKEYKASIIISEETRAQLGQSQSFNLRPLGSVQVKGKKMPVTIHECFDADAPDTKTQKQTSLSLFSAGLDQYLKSSFREAAATFRRIVEVNPHDQTAMQFLLNAEQLNHTD